MMENLTQGGALQPYEGQPEFSDAEILFLKHYSQSLDRVDAMQTSGLARSCGPRPSADTLELVASGIIRKAEHMPIAHLASALGADLVAYIRKLWDVCCSPEPHEAIKGLQLMGRIHGLWNDERSRGKTPIKIVMHQPAPPPSVVTGLPFSIEPDTSNG